MNLKKLLMLSLTIVSVQQSFAQSSSALNALTGTLPSAPAQYLGSSNAADVLFKSSGVERMRMLSTGNIGIGTTAPTASLNIATTGAVPFFIQRTAGQVNGLKMFFTSNPAVGVSVGAGSAIFQNTATVADLVFMPTPTLCAMTMKPNGNVGVGTTTPTSHFEVLSGSLGTTGGSQVAWAKLAGDVGTGNQDQLKIFNQRVPAGGSNWNSSEIKIQRTVDVTNMNFISFRSTDPTWGFGAIVFGNDNTDHMKISWDGKVSIGDVTTPAGYKLYVETGILTEKVKVAVKNTANWADYVFEKNYNLKSLSEVEAFINTNKHLPEIPSAEEVVKEGSDLGEMNVKLLQKVEELTLYLIEQNKKIEAVQKELEKLKK